MIPTKRSKRERNNKKDIISGRRRSLSDLPDNVVLNILSLLPIKDAVRTSTLSKSWKDKWTTIPKLCFDQGNTNTEHFMDFVERALSQRRSSKITKFQLIGHMEASSPLESLISAAAECNVEEFELRLQNLKEPLTLPIKLVISPTLTHLHIGMVMRGQKLTLPFLIQLPSLKVLELCGIIFPNHHSAQNLFHGCPSLEDLQLVDCKWLDLKTVRLTTSKKLQKLRIDEAYDRNHGQHDGQEKPEFVILGSALRHFDYTGVLFFDYCIMDPALLEEVTINIDDYGSSHLNRIPIAYLLLKLLSSVSHAPKLKLGRSTISYLLKVPEGVNEHMLLGVRHVEVDYKSSDLSDVDLLKVLESTPYLESLVFRQGLMMPSNPTEDGLFDPMPPCFLNHLSYVFVYIQYGDDLDLVGIKVLLKNAMVLRKMEILFGSFATAERRNRFLVELLKVPRASKDCGIYVF